MSLPRAIGTGTGAGASPMCRVDVWVRIRPGRTQTPSQQDGDGDDESDDGHAQPQQQSHTQTDEDRQVHFTVAAAAPDDTTHTGKTDDRGLTTLTVCSASGSGSTSGSASASRSASGLRRVAPAVVPSRMYRGLSGVLGPSVRNDELYRSVVSPLVDGVLAGGTGLLFAYGHSGSGKTHSIVGYGGEPGMYRHAVDALTQAIAARSDLRHLRLQVSVRCAELYQGRLLDLLADGAECFLREDAQGQVHIRSATQMDSAGRVRVQSLHAAYATHSADVCALVERALASRVVGDSPVHAQSSRSHALIELQLVTPALLAAREDVLQAEARLVPIGKARDDLYIATMSRCYRPDPQRPGAFIQDLAAVSQEEHEQLEQLQRQVAQAEQRLQEARQREREAVGHLASLLRQECHGQKAPASAEHASASTPAAEAADAADVAGAPSSGSFSGGASPWRECGTLVLVDLAGAEYASLDLPHAGPSAGAATAKGKETGPGSAHASAARVKGARSAAAAGAGSASASSFSSSATAAAGGVRVPAPGSRSSVSLSEGREINRSLLSLKECMRALSRGSAHVPFRNSKLTLLLRRYLRADATSAVCLATVASDEEQIKATTNTLQYAALLAEAAAETTVTAIAAASKQ